MDPNTASPNVVNPNAPRIPGSTGTSFNSTTGTTDPSLQDQMNHSTNNPGLVPGTTVPQNTNPTGNNTSGTIQK
jgi:hypothetical protein